MVVGVQEEEWEGEKAVPFFFFFQPEDSQLHTTPQSSVRQHTLHKVLTKQSIAQQLFTCFVTVTRKLEISSFLDE